MLWFIGLGISGFESISSETRRILSQADFVYLEQFTSPISKSDISKIKKITKGDFKLAKRWMVEDGSEILKNAKTKKVVLLAYGDPFIATTHIELRTRAHEEKIKTKSIHSASSLTSLVGESGLQFYKVGRIVTIMDEQKILTTPYYVIYKNIIDGNHTVLLLEYNQDQDFFLRPQDALLRLIDTEKGQKRKVLDNNTFVIVASRIGFKNQKIIAGNISSIKNIDFGKPPHSIIIPGRLHFTESDSLKLVAECIDEPISNTDNVKKISKQMLEKYIPMVREAIKEMEIHYKDDKNFSQVLENAELYIKDSEKFLEDGMDEVAILSIGYADGLIDALRIGKGFEPKM